MKEDERSKGILILLLIYLLKGNKIFMKLSKW